MSAAIFAGKSLLLTGAAGGIAREIAAIFHASGASLLLQDLAEAPLRALADSLDPSGRRVATLAGNVADRADNERAVALCRDRFGGIDFLVPAAGIYPSRLVAEMTDSEWHRVISINLDGIFYLTRAAIPAMRPGGAVVNITSVAGHRGSFAHAHYAASKGALLSFTRSLALELAPAIRVNAVSPGIIETDMVKELLGERGPRLIDNTPLRRLGTPKEVAEVVAFLCGPAASFITGEAIHVNGGLHMAG